MPAEEGAPRRVRGESISSMSQLLLQGWAMLADSCPYCGVPLMRHPSGAQLLCVNCGRETATGGGEQAPAETEPTPHAAASAGQEPPMANGTGVSSSDEEEGGSGLIEAPQSLSTRLRQAAGISAAASATAAGASGGAAAERVTLRPAAAAAASGTGGEAETQHDASKEIAELMLEGWAMLQDHCPRCLNPLLRSRDRRIYCAGCQMYAVRESEQGQLRQGAGQQVQEQQQEQQPQVPGDQRPSAAVAAGPSPAMAPASPAAATAPVAASLLTSAVAGSAPSAPSPLDQHLPAVDAAAAAVTARLTVATTALRAAGSTAEACEQLAQLQHCASALQALADCRRSLRGRADGWRA